MAQPTGEVCLLCRRMARHCDRLSFRTTDQAVGVPENAVRCFAEPVN